MWLEYLEVLSRPGHQDHQVRHVFLQHLGGGVEALVRQQCRVGGSGASVQGEVQLVYIPG